MKTISVKSVQFGKVQNLDINTLLGQNLGNHKR